MHRTQIYLPEEAYRALREIGQRRRLTLAEVIRQAVERYLDAESAQALQEALQASRGAWSGRVGASEDMVRALRNEWEQRELRHRHGHPD
ncbi:MAG: CopG family transcriptional regulator [Candidatus Eremiobacterota bacterium]